VVWRQHRLHFWSALALLLLIAGWTVHQRDALTTAERGYLQAGCSEGLTRARCFDLMDDALRQTTSTKELLWTMAAIPLLAGVFVGAPLIAQELERGTHRLMWTQSVTRTRWLTVKLVLPACGVLIFSSLLMGLSTWLRAAAHSRVRVMDFSWYDQPVYNTIGPVPVTSALLALALGTLVGLVLRRTIPAMAVTALLCAALAVGMDWLRRYLQPIHHIVVTGGYNLPGGTWLLADGVVLPDGRRVPFARCVPVACERGHREYENYHTAAQFWPMQWVEAGIMLALAAVLVAVTYRVLRRSVL
jgi:hypothetical protein